MCTTMWAVGPIAETICETPGDAKRIGDRYRNRFNEGQGFVESKPCVTCGVHDHPHVIWLHRKMRVRIPPKDKGRKEVTK